MAGAKLWLALGWVVTALGLAACGGDDSDEGGPVTAAEDETGTSTDGSSKPILIKTHLAHLNSRGETTGEVLSGSTVGDSAFCAGGKFTDLPGEPPEVTRTFRCSDGTLTIRFSPTPDGAPRQSSDWKVVKGLAGFEGLSGGGRMRALFESNTDEGRETFTGTVAR